MSCRVVRVVSFHEGFEDVLRQSVFILNLSQQLCFFLLLLHGIYFQEIGRAGSVLQRWALWLHFCILNLMFRGQCKRQWGTGATWTHGWNKTKTLLRQFIVVGKAYELDPFRLIFYRTPFQIFEDMDCTWKTSLDSSVRLVIMSYSRIICICRSTIKLDIETNAYISTNYGQKIVMNQKIANSFLGPWNLMKLPISNLLLRFYRLSLLVVYCQVLCWRLPIPFSLSLPFWLLQLTFWDSAAQDVLSCDLFFCRTCILVMMWFC